MTRGPGLSVVEEFVESKDRTKLFLRSWRPDHVRALMVAVHEPGADGARYGCLAETLATQGVATCAMDLRGCGHSAGSRSAFTSIDRYLPDVEAMVCHATRGDPTMPLFMSGHGVGAAIVCHHAVRHERSVDGIICEAVALDPPWAAAIRRRFPVLSGAFGLARAPLPGFQPRLRKPLGELSLPLLLLHGSKDAIASPSDSERLHTRVRSTDKTLQLFEGYDHPLIDGPGHALVREKIGQWIQAQLDASSRRRRIGIEYINE